MDIKITIEVIPHDPSDAVIHPDDLREINSQLDTYLDEAVAQINQHLRFSSIRIK